MHSRTLFVREWLRHETRDEAGLSCEFLDDVSCRHDVIGHGERIGVAQVNFVLSRSVLVLGVLHPDTHLLESQHGLTTQHTASVIGQEIKVTAVIDGNGSTRSLDVGEVEVLQFGSDVKRVSLVVCVTEDSPELLTRATFKDRTVGVDDVAKYSGDTFTGLVPRQKLERGQVGSSENV